MIEAVGVTDPGCIRSNNEDYFLIAREVGLYVVADGMGGAQAGEHASKIAAETVREMVTEANHPVTAAALARDPNMEGMGTTLVAAMEMGNDIVVASVGDSRVYIYENGTLRSITEDQTWVNEVGRKLGLDEESLKTHPMRHVLTMAIGVSEQPRVQTYLVKPARGVQILLCSDGLHGVAPEKDIASTLEGNGSLQAKCDELIAAARANGGPDNITAVLLKAS
jgi:serine/threonine protein phosphatase PrpC